jgi:hypothetical protein
MRPSWNEGSRAAKALDPNGQKRGRWHSSDHGSGRPVLPTYHAQTLYRAQRLCKTLRCRAFVALGTNIAQPRMQDGRDDVLDACPSVVAGTRYVLVTIFTRDSELRSGRSTSVQPDAGKAQKAGRKTMCFRKRRS